MTSIPEYNLLKIEAQVKIEFALESSEKFSRSKPTSHSVKLTDDCLEISQSELLMMEYSFDFHSKFSNYEQYRLAEKRKKKNSIIIMNRDDLMKDEIRH